MKPSQLTDDGFSEGNANKVRVWVFFFIAGTFMNIGGAIWVTAAHFGDSSLTTPYPGIGLIVQTVLMFLSGTLFFLGRGQKSSLGF